MKCTPAFYAACFSKDCANCGKQAVEASQNMKRFVVYRPNPPDNYVKDGYANPVDQVQYEGVVFTDGSVAIRWRTETASMSYWDSFESLMKIHGHPEYGTIVKWIDTQ